MGNLIATALVIALLAGTFFAGFGVGYMRGYEAKFDAIVGAMVRPSWSMLLHEKEANHHD